MIRTDEYPNPFSVAYVQSENEHDFERQNLLFLFSNAGSSCVEVIPEPNLNCSAAAISVTQPQGGYFVVYKIKVIKHSPGV